MLIRIFFQFLLAPWSVISHYWRSLVLALFFSCCYGTVLVLTAGSWFLCHPSLLLFREFLFKCYSLPIVWGFLALIIIGRSCALFSCGSSPMVWGILAPTLLEGLVCNFACCPSPIAWGIPWSNTVEKFRYLLVNLCSNRSGGFDLVARLSCWHGFIVFLIRGPCSVYLAFTLASRYSFVSVDLVLIFVPFWRVF